MNWRMFLILPPLGLGVAIFMWMTSGDDRGQSIDIPEAALAVRVSKVTPERFVAEASGFGRVQAIHTWQAISQVAGRAIDVSPNVAIGALVEPGDLLVRIDPREYEIAMSIAQTAIASARASIRELEATLSNTNATLKLEQEIQASYQAEMERQLALVERGTISKASLDPWRRTLLSQQKVVLDLKNKLNLYPVQRETLEATLAMRMAELEEAERALTNIEIRAPFTGRITTTDIDVHEYVSVGKTLLEIEDTSASEVTAEIQPSVLSALFLSASIDLRTAILEVPDLKAAFEIIHQLGLTAEVRLVAGEQVFVWPAEIARINGMIDSETGTLGVVVQVEDPIAFKPAERRRPLPNGSFVEVVFRASEQSGVILIERDALRLESDGSIYVYVANDDNRLERASVVVGPVNGDQVVISEGLKAGATLVLSDPQPAIIGMLLDPVVAELVPR
jgi:RND family efflux transporter MFP subunit